MATVAVEDGNPVRVTLLVGQLGSPKKGVFAKLFQSSIKGGFAQSGDIGDAKFTAAQKLPSGDVTMHLGDWSLDVECKFAEGVEPFKYVCNQFPSAVDPKLAKYEITEGKIVLKLPKTDASQIWKGALATKGLDQAP